MSDEKIKIVKLVSGEQFVAEVSLNDGSITVNKPTAMSVTQQGLQARPWLMLNDTDKTITIGNEFVVCITDADEEVTKIFNEQILNPSEIVQPTTGLVLPQ